MLFVALKGERDLYYMGNIEFATIVVSTKRELPIT